MTVLRVGATEKYSSGWEKAFGKGKKGKTVAAKKAPAKSAKKKSKSR